MATQPPGIPINQAPINFPLSPGFIPSQGPPLIHQQYVSAHQQYPHQMQMIHPQRANPQPMMTQTIPQQMPIIPQNKPLPHYGPNSQQLQPSPFQKSSHIPAPGQNINAPQQHSSHDQQPANSQNPSQSISQTPTPRMPPDPHQRNQQPIQFQYQPNYQNQIQASPQPNNYPLPPSTQPQQPNYTNYKPPSTSQPEAFSLVPPNPSTATNFPPTNFHNPPPMLTPQQRQLLQCQQHQQQRSPPPPRQPPAVEPSVEDSISKAARQEEVERIRSLLPDELRAAITTKSRSNKVGFATILWHMLNWVGNDQERSQSVGCQWMNKTEFWMDKQRLADIIGCQINTFNFKLRACKFQQYRQRRGSVTFWKCENFSQQSTADDLDSIEMRRSLDSQVPSITIQALYLPLLDQVRLFTTMPLDVPKFKGDAILLWEDIIGSSTIWACSAKDFIESAVTKFCNSFMAARSGDTFTFDAQQTEFAQYLKTNNLNILNTARSMLSYVMTNVYPQIVTITDFCQFYARFGPESCVLEKIHQLLCCSKTFDNWFLPGEQKFDQRKAITGSYSNTFANAFIIKRAQGATYHVYNMPSMNTHSGFLVDETGKNFLTWHAVFESFSMAATQQNINFDTFI